MNTVDLAVLGGLAALAAAPALPRLSLLLKARPKPSQAAAERSQDAWRQQWTSTLIDLLGDLEEMDMAPASKLCRELMWEIIGGEPETTGKK
jgi:hypothetical protein